MNNALHTYVMGSCMYGACRGIIRASHMKRRDKKTDTSIENKMTAVALSTIYAPSMLPMFVYNDVNRFYLTYTNGDFNKFGYKNVDTHVLHILFS